MNRWEKLLLYKDIFGWRGVLLDLGDKLTKRSRSKPAKVPGSNCIVQVRTRSSDPQTYAKIFLDQEYDVPLALEPKVIIDAGANVGYATVFFAAKFPRARIISIEPESQNFEILKRNTASLPNVSCMKAALWQKSGALNLLDPGLGSWGFEAAEINGKPASSQTIETIPAVTIDQLMKDRQIDFIDILKVDIEGAEKGIFGDPSTWINKVGVIMIELHDRRQVGCSRNFYHATRDFETELRKGENVFMLRKSYVTAPVA